MGDSGALRIGMQIMHTEAKLLHAPTAVVHDDVRGGVSLVIGSSPVLPTKF